MLFRSNDPMTSKSGREGLTSFGVTSGFSAYRTGLITVGPFCGMVLPGHYSAAAAGKPARYVTGWYKYRFFAMTAQKPAQIGGAGVFVRETTRFGTLLAVSRVKGRCDTAPGPRFRYWMDDAA